MLVITVRDREVRNLLKRLALNVKNRKPVMRRIAHIMLDAVEENFEQEGRPRWKRSRRAIIQGGKTLQDTGSLAASINTRYTNDYAMVGTNKVYARIHQLGFRGRVSVKSHERRTQRGRVTVKSHSKRMNMPARPFLKLTRSDISLIRTELIRYITSH